VNSSEKRKILSEIVAMAGLPSRIAGDFTASEYALEAKCAESTARKRLRKLVQEGVLQCEERMGAKGGPVIAYWKGKGAL